MDKEWHNSLDLVANELRAIETVTPDGPVVIDALLRLIDVLGRLGEASASAAGPAAREVGGG